MKIDIAAWVQAYETQGKLPELRVPCVNEHCNTTTTCFGSNLENRIQRSGGLQNLLETFECRGCRTASKPAKAPVIKPPKVRAQSKPEVLAPPTTNIHVAPTRYNLTDPTHVQEMTTGQCQRPDIYLNNDRSCDGCVLYDACACTRKRLAA